MANIVITVLVAIHLAVTLWHGNAHTELSIALPPGKNVFVVVVILIAPLVAAALVWTCHALVGLWVFFVSMLGALLFGAYHHYILVSPDNIGHLPHGNANAHWTFIASAGALALLELASALYGAFCLGRPLGKIPQHKPGYPLKPTMGITYMIEPDSGLVVLTAIGLVSNRDVRRAQEALQRDPVFRAEYR